MERPVSIVEIEGELTVETPAGSFVIQGTFGGTVVLVFKQMGTLWHLFRFRKEVYGLSRGFVQSGSSRYPEIRIYWGKHPLAKVGVEGNLRASPAEFFGSLITGGKR